jgi:hypothetical protein
MCVWGRDVKRLSYIFGLTEKRKGAAAYSIFPDRSIKKSNEDAEIDAVWRFS